MLAEVNGLAAIAKWVVADLRSFKIERLSRHGSMSGLPKPS